MATSVHYLPFAAWHLIKHTAQVHPPKIIGAVAGFFVFQLVMGRLRSGRWGDSFFLAAITTAILVFIAASIYILVTRPGYRFF